MTNISPIRCVLVGGQSLLLQCAHLLTSHNHSIVAVVSDEDAVHTWCKKNTISSFTFTNDNLENIAELEFDYLFSIANLRVLPDYLISRPNKLAINFHNGRLPDYAGLNTPSWALINHEQEHAINWHIITNELDKGDILESETFPIDPAETSLSLNTKCFEVGIKTFEKLLGNIESDTVKPVKQNLANYKYYAKCQRPDAMAMIEWNRAAEDIDALMRALNFGQYLNPLGLPKLSLGDEVVIIKNLSVTGKRSGVAPGTVMSLNDVAVVATSTNDVIIDKLMAFDGQELSAGNIIAGAGFKVGDVLPQLAPDINKELTDCDREYCRHEDYWIDTLKNQQPLTIPYANKKAANQSDLQRSSLKFTIANDAKLVSKNDGDFLLKVLVVYLAKLSQSDYFSIGLSAVKDAQQDTKKIYIAEQLPLTVDLSGQAGLAEVFAYLSDKFTTHRRHGSYARDLVLRTPGLTNQMPGNLPVALLGVKNLQEKYSITSNDLSIVIPEEGNEWVWHFNDSVLSAEIVQKMHEQFEGLLGQVISSPESKLHDISIITPGEITAISQWNETQSEYDKDICVHQLFERQVAKTPNAIALSYQGEDHSYAELNKRANQIAHLLISHAIKPDDLVGILIDRSVEMVVAMLGVMKAGAAYLPLDPSYPHDRIQFMIHDSGMAALITQEKNSSGLQGFKNTILIDKGRDEISVQSGENPGSTVKAVNLAYIIYTSGSTGKPKGVMVQHNNVVNFFAGMDQRIGRRKPGVWLAVTSISFDISVLELFWTLTRGFQVVLYSDAHVKTAKTARSKYPEKDMQFSLFYWNVANDESEYDEQKYRLLIESVKYGDQNDFSAVWTPERHFHAFGGLYPNPSVTSAALATITNHIQIRAGSCVLPLHHPIRVVEEWSMVDNFSNGRVGLAIAAGWQPNDFVIMPQNHADAKKIMFESIEHVKRLWRGEELEFTGPKGNPVKVRTLPRPIQKEVPIWITTAGNPETFKLAGQIGANVLTHLLGQSVEDVAKNLAIYREAYQAAGHDGEGQVTLLLHTLVGKDNASIKAIARAPMKNYLKSAMFLVKAAAWHFPTFKELSQETGQTLDEYFASISDDDMDALLEFAFERYFSTSGLFGTPENCLDIVDSLKEIGVTEIGCLIDYGIPTDTVLEHLPHLNTLRIIAGKSEHTDIDDADNIPELIKKYAVTHFQCTPSMASMLLTQADSPEAFKSLECMMVGGEALQPTLATQLTQAVGGKLVNMYGPTETTIWSTTQEIHQDEKIYIGKPIVNTDVYVMDRHLQLVPIGLPGELYIGGEGVTRGYLKRPELTAERFIQNPFRTGNAAKIYKTGDLVRYTNEGVLEYFGRTDFQVKIRGHRIELGEIESVLLHCPGVHEAVAIVREDTPGDQRLVAYVVKQQNTTITVEDLREPLRENLPDYMVPSHIVFLDELPLTPNRKIDRNALPLPAQDTSEAGDRFQAPTNITEQVVADIWSGVLGTEKVSINDNFFEAGGHSLLATQLIAQLRKTFQVELPLHAIFDTPTIAGLSQAMLKLEQVPGWIENIAKSMNEAASDKTAKLAQLQVKQTEFVISKYPRTERLPLSFGQQRLWFLDKLEPGSHYNDAFALRLCGDLQIEALENSINKIIARHEILRTIFESTDGSPYQVILPSLQLALQYVDLRGTADSNAEEKLHSLIAKEIARPIDLAAGPVLRTNLYQVKDNEYVFLLVIHQISNDSWSLGVFMDELWNYYQASIQGVEAEVPTLPIQYADYAYWQRNWLESHVIDKELSYWQNKLSGDLPVLDLPADYPRPAIQSFTGARHFIAIPDELVVKLRKLSTELGCTPFIILLSVLKTLLYRHCGQTDVIVGTPIANRGQTETSQLIGMFINNLVLRSDLSGNPSFRELVERVVQTTVGAYDNPNVPFERLVEMLHPERDLSRTPLFQIMFDYQNTPMQIPKLENLNVDLQRIDGKMSRLDLTLELSEITGTIKGHIEYNTALFAKERIERMGQHFINLLQAVVATPDNRINELPVLSEQEKAQLLYHWHGAKSAYPADKAIHQLFETQVQQRPDATAVIFDNKSITYQQLNSNANQLANYLRQSGVTENIFVGICTDRSIEMVVAMLAVLKTGAAYLPLDPSYPEDRIAYMLEDSQAEYLVTTDEMATRLSGLNTRIISLDTPLTTAESNLNVDISSGDLAYIIYTSGSTGKPKGVEVPHRGVVNFLCSMQREPGINNSDVLLAVTTICFDISVLEIFLPLISGATIVLADSATTVDGRRLVEVIRERGVTYLQATPATWRLLLAAGWEGSDKLTALCGGEAMPADLVQELVPRAGKGLWNMYGPTETTIWSTCYRLKDVNDTPVIGKPIANTDIYILDANLQALPVGIPGELYIGGDGVVRGYHSRPELTAERFIKSPFGNSDNHRIYKTGDLVRYRADGNLEYLQRIDNQVKVRGFRIELGEIENALINHAAIKQAVVTVHEERPGDKRLVAYVVYDTGKQATVSELRKYLKSVLPEYMVPAMYVDMHVLPLTPNGKVNRKALPNPFQQYSSVESIVPPRTDMEKTIAKIWQDVLYVDKINVHDNFFDLGGHSLLSMQVIARIEKETGCEIGPRAMVMDTLEQISASCPQMSIEDKSANVAGENKYQPGIIATIRNFIRRK